MSQKMTVAEYRKETGTGEEISETPLSKQIAGVMNMLHLENDRIQSGKIYHVSEYTSKKTGITKTHGRWIHFAKAGTPDRWCLIHGRWCLVEVKKKGEEPTWIQKQRHKELRASGAIVLIFDDLETAHRELAQLKANLDPKVKTAELTAALIAVLDELDGVNDPVLVASMLIKAIKEHGVL